MRRYTPIHHIEEKEGWLESHKQLTSPESLSPDVVEKVEHRSLCFIEEYVPLLTSRRCVGLTVDTLTYLTPMVDSVTFTASRKARGLSSYALPIDPCCTEDNLVQLLYSHREIPTLACMEIHPGLEEPEEEDDEDEDDTQTDDGESEPDEEEAEEFEDSVSYHSNASSWLRANDRRCREAAEADSIPIRNPEEENPPISRLAYLQTTSSSGQVLAGFLCLTKADDISNALAACVFHRWIWGIRDVPVLGLALDSRYGQLVYAVFAQAQRIEGSSCLSIVLWYDPAATFDLTDGGDVLRLSLLVAAFTTNAQILPQLALPSSAMREALESDDVPCWRVDIAKSMVVADEQPSIEDRVSHWMDSDDSEEEPSLPSISPPPSSSVKTSSQSSDYSDPVTSLLGGPSTSPSHRLTLSCSAFARGEGDDPSRLTRQYLTACIASPQFIPPEKMIVFLDSKDLSDNMLLRVEVSKRYYANAQLAWVESSELPEVYRSHSLVEEMHGAYQSMSNTKDPLLRQTPDDPNVLRALKGSIGFLCNLHDDIQNITKERGVDQLHEAVCKRYVARLIDHFSNAPIDPAVDVVLGSKFEQEPVIWSSHEQHISLPRSDLAFLTNDSMLGIRAAIAELDTSSYEFATLLEDWWKATVNTTDKTYIYSIQTADIWHQEATIPDTSHNAFDMERQYLREPYHAICDSTISIAIPGVFKDIDSDPTRSFNLILPTYAGTGNSAGRPHPPVGNHKRVTRITSLWALSQSRTVSTDRAKHRELALNTTIQASTATRKTSASAMMVHPLASIEPMGSVAHSMDRDTQRDLHIPVSTFVSRRDSIQAANLNRIHGSAGAKFLAALGIRNMELYGFIVRGFEVLMTISYAEDIRTNRMLKYIENPDSVCRVTTLDGNAIKFDLLNPIQLVNFAVVLIRLRIEHVPRILNALGLKDTSPGELRRLPELTRGRMQREEKEGVAAWKRPPR